MGKRGIKCRSYKVEKVEKAKKAKKWEAKDQLLLLARRHEEARRQGGTGTQYTLLRRLAKCSAWSGL